MIRALPHPRRHTTRLVAVALGSALALGLAGCAGDDDATARAAGARTAEDGALPTPERTAGSVTGMPDAPGPGTTPLQPVGELPGDAAVAAGSLPPIDPLSLDVPAPSIAFEPTPPEVAPIAVAPVDPRTGDALQAGAPTAEPEATASTTIVVDVPVQPGVED